MLDHRFYGIAAYGPAPFAYLRFTPCFDPVTLAVIAAGATAASTGVSAMGTIAGGKAAQQSAEYQAKQLDEKAKLERESGMMELAGGQKEAAEYKRRKELALSAGQARAASSGFSATDPTSLALADEIARYGTLQEETAVYGGTTKRAASEAQARVYQAQGAGSRYEGKVAKKASKIKAAGTILEGISTIAGRFGGGFSTGSAARYGGSPSASASGGPGGRYY